MKPAPLLIATLAVSVLTACSSSTGSVGPPHLADPPSGLTRACEDPVRLAGAEIGAALAQASVVERWAQDRAALVACKRRHQGLVEFYRVRDDGLRK